MMQETKKMPYQKPDLKTWGTIADLTQVGCTNPGGDAKCGSVLNGQTTLPGLGDCGCPT
jgi:hypothetical protein